MKTSIPSEVWDQKKALIARLYMEEEWPLKQVIKQIRSEHFNPSETQLRSRLKKWRVTKPSRRVRKKSQQSGLGDDAALEENLKMPSSSTSPSSPTQQQSSSAVQQAFSTQSDKTEATSYATPDQQSRSADGKWNAALIQQLTPSPSWEHVAAPDINHPVQNFDHRRTSDNFEPSVQTSSVRGSLMLNTTSALTPAVPAYPLSPESCLPSPGQVTTAPLPTWPARSVSADMSHHPVMHPGQWYPMPSGPVTTSPNASQSAPDYRGLMPMVTLFADENYHQQVYHEASEFHGFNPKTWKRKTHFPNDRPWAHGLFEHQEGKNLSPQVPSPLSPGMMQLSSTQPAGVHSMMCAPVVPYMGHDSMAQQPPGVGY